MLPALAVALHFRATRAGRCVRLAVCRTCRFRQAVQPGPLFAHRPAGGAVGVLRAALPGPVALAGTWLVCLDRGFGIDHLPASLHRCAHRRPGRVVMCVAVATGPSRHAAIHATDTGPPALAPGTALRARCRAVCPGGLRPGRRRIVAVLASSGTAAGGAELCVVRCQRLSKSAGWPFEQCCTLVVGAVPGGRLDQFAAVDPQAPAARSDR
ncbi:hypothetical protein D9M71_576430 [compost metagenome]